MRAAIMRMFVVFGLALSLATGVAWADDAPVTVGSREQARWTETTVQAAKNPAEQAALHQGKITTVTGEIVDVSCYLQLDKRGPGHVACGAGCLRTGQPAGLLTTDGHLYLMLPEEHDPRRGGLVSIREFFSDHVGQTATVTGLLVKRDGYRALFVAGAPLTPAAVPSPGAGQRAVPALDSAPGAAKGS